MIIKPCSYDLVTAVQRIEEDPRIAFEMTRRITPLEGLNHNDWPVITTLDMTGPRREYAKQNPRGDGYTGPIWRSEVRLSSRFRRVERTVDHLIEEILGKPNYADIRERGHFREGVLRYDFTVDQQPEQQAPAPHIIYLEIREKTGSNGRVFGSIGDLRNKILRTPKLYKLFYNKSPEEIALARAELARR